VVGPVRGGSLTPSARRVKRGHALLQPIKKARVAEEIADRIRRLILDGTLPADRPLPGERQLAVRFGVSRGSVRDALRVLETIGLTESRHGQGTFARELDVGRLVAPLSSILTYRHDLRDELFDVRRMFEPAVARVAAVRVTDADVEALERLLDAQRRKLKAGASAIAEDAEFHAALARATQNSVVVRIMETLNDLLIESRKQTLSQRGRPVRSLEGHEAVVAALRRRDPEGAAQAMHRHIDQIGALMQERTQPALAPRSSEARRARRESLR
jgi:GntR family transcriptional repressor for pyruvate dehydrogenase complex